MSKYIMILKSTNVVDIWAASASYADVAIAVAASESGDIIGIPAGSATWESELVISKEIVIIGAGRQETVITIGSGITLGNAAFKYSTGVNDIRISGIGFNGNYTCVGNGVHFEGEHHRFRVDHCGFSYFGPSSRPFIADGYCDGVIDNCYCLDNLPTIFNYWGDGATGWTRPEYLGMDVALNNGLGVIFYEDNEIVFTQAFVDLYEPSPHIVASNYGSRYVYRYNTTTAAYNGANYLADPHDSHGAYEMAKGSVSVEIYENMVTTARTYRGVNIRGGTGVVFNNTFTGTIFGNLVNLTEYKCFSVGKAEFGGNCPHGYCYNACPDTPGAYPTLDQIHDLYIWNNTKNGIVNNAVVPNTGHNLYFLQEGRDFFNIEKSGYIPYTYPHPLRG